MTYKITAQQKKSNIVKQERAKWYKNLENAGVQFPLDAKLEARKAKTSERDNAHLAKMELKASIAPVKHTNNTQVFRLSKGIGFYSGPIDKFNPEFKFLRTLAQRFALLSKKNSCSVVVAQQSDSTMAFVLSKEVPCTQMNKPKSTTSNKGFIEMISMINTKIKTQNKDLLTKALNKAAYLNAKHDSKVQLDEETRQTAVKGPSAGLTDLALMIARKVVRQNGNPKVLAF